MGSFGNISLNYLYNIIINLFNKKDYKSIDKFFLRLHALVIAPNINNPCRENGLAKV
jgi:hypothetical protein